MRSPLSGSGNSNGISLLTPWQRIPGAPPHHPLAATPQTAGISSFSLSKVIYERSTHVILPSLLSCKHAVDPHHTPGDQGLKAVRQANFVENAMRVRAGPGSRLLPICTGVRDSLGAGPQVVTSRCRQASRVALSSCSTTHASSMSSGRSRIQRCAPRPAAMQRDTQWSTVCVRKCCSSVRSSAAPLRSRDLGQAIQRG